MLNVAEKIETDSRFESPAVRSLGYHIRQLSESWSEVLRRALDNMGVTTAQWRYLRELWGDEAFSQRELSERVGRRGPTTISALRLLERSKLAVTETVPHDLRKTMVRLTPRGKELRERCAVQVKELEEVALHGLSEREVKQFKRTIAKIQRNLDNHGSGRNSWGLIRSQILWDHVGL